MALSFGMTDRSLFSIIPIGSLHAGWALKVDGVLRRSSPNLIALGAFVDAIMAAVGATVGAVGSVTGSKPLQIAGCQPST